MQPTDIVIIVAGLGFGVLMTSGVFFVLSRVSGWPKLAQRFPAAPPMQGASWALGSIAMGARWMRYNNCVRIGVDDEHLHIRLLRICSLFHPPMSIPWALVRFPEKLPRGKWSIGLLRLGVEGGGTVWLPVRSVRRELAVRRAMAADA